MKTFVRGAAAAAAIALLATACGSDSTTGDGGDGAGSGKKSYTIGIANQQESVTFPAALAKGAKAAAKKLGIKVVSLDSQGDQAKQASQVQDLIARRVDAIVLVPLSPGPAQALVDQAAAAKIPIATAHGYVGADRKAEDPYGKLKFVLDEDEVGAGATAGELAKKALPDGGKVAVIEGAAGFVENVNRVVKFKQALKEDGSKYRIVASQPGDWTKEKGQAACQNILASRPDIGLFYALSDDMAVGCASAVKAAGSKAKIVGVGGSASGIQGIKNGQVYGTVCYKPYDEGVRAVRMMHEVLTGKLKGAPKTTFYDTPGVTKADVDSCTPQW